MAQHGKRYQELAKLVDRSTSYAPDDGHGPAHARPPRSTSTRPLRRTSASASTRATPTRWCAARSSCRTASGKTVRVLVFAQGDKAQEALRAGADEVGGEDLVKRIEAGWLEFDVALATPDMMGMVGKLGRILGRRGLMPNPKSGTITFDLERAIKEVKAGRVEFKVDKAGIIHVPFGKASFEPQQLIENLAALVDAINRAKPSAVEGPLLQEPDGGVHDGPGHPRRRAGHAGQGSRLGHAPADPAAGRATEDRSATDSVASEALHAECRADSPQRSNLGRPAATDRTEIVDRTNGWHQPAEGTPTGTPRQGHSGHRPPSSTESGR